MKKYYYIKDENKLGPFDLEDLKSTDIKRDTLVWFQGIKDWTRATEISELGELFIHHPPPIPNIQTKNYRKLLQILTLTCLVGSVIAWVEIESIIFSGPIATIISLMAFNFSEGESKNQRVISLIPLFVSFLCLLMILIGDLGTSEAVIPIGTTISIGTILFIFLTFNKIKPQ
jgi:hypothetical protein